MCPVKNFSPPSSETSQWKTFVRVCELNKSDCRAILSLEYTTMQRLSMFGIHKNANSLTNAGISDAKAHMIILFATYMLHMKHHQQTIPKDVTFDQIIEFNYRLSTQNVTAGAASKEAEKDLCWDSRGSFCSQLSMDSIIHSSDASVSSRKSCMKKVSWAKQSSEVEKKQIRRSQLFTLDESSTSTTVDSLNSASCASRWSSCDTTTASLSSGKRSPQNSSHEPVVPPPRRPSLGEESYDRLLSLRNKKKVEPTTSTTNNLPPSRPTRSAPPTPATPAERSTLRWAVAMSVNEELTDSESEWSDDDYSDSEGDESFATKGSIHEDSDNTTKTGWESRIATAHEWTLPANQVLPVNLQALFRRAAENPTLDIQQEIAKAMAASANNASAAPTPIAC